MTRIAFLTMDSLDNFVAYDQLVTEELQRHGVTVDEISWRQPNVAWSDYQLVVIRSPWDYQQAPHAFLDVLNRIEAAGTRLENPLSVCRWNYRKSYLQDLAAAGIRTIPTIWSDGVSEQILAQAAAQLQTPELIIKPLIGANADDTSRIPAAPAAEQLLELITTYTGKSVLIQPFLPRVLDPGEYSLIYFDGNYSHTILKTPAVGDFRVQEEHGSTITAITPPAIVQELAQQTVAALPADLLYARIDVLLMEDQQPAVIEVELIEPSLYLPFHDEAAARFCAAILRRLPDRIQGS